MNILVGQTKQEMLQMVLLNQWTDKVLIEQWLATLLEIKEQNYDDFLDCFTENGSFYTVFCYREGRNLLQYVQTEKLALPYKVVLLQNVLEEYLQYQHYNDILQYCMLQYYNIMIQNHAIFFNYQLLLLPDQKEYNCFSALEQTMKVIFTNEELKSIPKLLIVMQKCEKRLYQSLAEVIKDLQNVSGAVEKEKSIQHYIAQKRKNNRKKIMTVFVFLAVLGMIYKVYDYYTKSTEDAFLYTELEKIGTVEIASQAGHTQQQDMVVEVKQKQQPFVAEPPAYQAPPIEQPETEQPEQAKTYVVQKGNHLTYICLKYYNDIGYLQSLADYNHIANINLIYTGQVLTLPPKEQLQKIPVRQYRTKPKGNITKSTVPKTETEVKSAPETVQNSQNDMEGYLLLLEEEEYN